jgi:hypothetical protein
MGVPVTTAWRVLGWWMEGRPLDMEGTHEYTEKAVRLTTRSDIPGCGLRGGLTIPHRKTKRTAGYETLHKAPDLDGLFGYITSPTNTK